MIFFHYSIFSLSFFLFLLLCFFFLFQNYNKSRIHSFRGVRDVEIFLDDVKIFEGEIKR